MFFQSQVDKNSPSYIEVAGSGASCISALQVIGIVVIWTTNPSAAVESYSIVSGSATVASLCYTSLPTPHAKSSNVLYHLFGLTGINTVGIKRKGIHFLLLVKNKFIKIINTVKSTFLGNYNFDLQLSLKHVNPTLPC